MDAETDNGNGTVLIVKLEDPTPSPFVREGTPMTQKADGVSCLANEGGIGSYGSKQKNKPDYILWLLGLNVMIFLILAICKVLHS